MMGVVRGRLLEATSAPARGERVERLWAGDGVVVEHILSGRLTGPADYVQDQDEWVAVLEGSAELEVRDELLSLAAGDWVLLPRGTPHRLLSTEPGTRWLAVHVGRSGAGVTGPAPLAGGGRGCGVGDG